MRLPTKLLIILVLLSIVLAFVPATTRAFQLVPCGGGEYPNACQFKDLITLLIRMINYLITVAALVAMYYILSAGFYLVTALGNEEKIKKNKEAIREAVVGFAIVVLAFVFVNLLVNGILGKSGATRPWWDPKCIYDIKTGCPLGISVNQEDKAQ